jgi:hypothetical protein
MVVMLDVHGSCQELPAPNPSHQQVLSPGIPEKEFFLESSFSFSYPFYFYYPLN